MSAHSPDIPISRVMNPTFGYTAATNAKNMAIFHIALYPPSKIWEMSPSTAPMNTSMKMMTAVMAEK